MFAPERRALRRFKEGQPEKKRHPERRVMSQGSPDMLLGIGEGRVPDDPVNGLARPVSQKVSLEMRGSLVLP
jgi:hypothetical protein